jgi:ATP/ADP translocase
MALVNQRVSRLLNIHPGEGRMVVMAFLLYFCLCLPYSFTYSAAYALFIDEFGSQGLPYYYLAIAVAIPLVTLALLRLSGRLSQTGYLRLLLLILVIGAFLLWLAANFTHHQAVTFSLVVWKDLMFVFMVVIFWNTANSLFDARQGKRLFPLLGVAYSLADIVGGLLIPPLVASLGTANLLFFAAVILCVALFIQKRVFNLAHLTMPGTLGTERAKRQPPLGKAIRDPYLLLLFGLVVVYWLAYYTTNTIFYDRAGLSFPDADSLAAFIGRYTVLVGTLSLLLDTFITGRVIERYGMRNGLLSLPVMLGIIGTGMFIAILSGAPAILIFIFSVLLMLASDSLGGLSDSSIVLLYQPLPAILRPRLQSIADGIVACLATGVAGVLLIGMENIWGINVLLLTALLLPILGVWIALIIPLMRQYLAWLGRALAHRRFGEGDLLIIDAAGLAILKRQLESPYPEAVIYAANRIEDAEPDALERLINQLISHPHALVRQDTLQRIERLRMSSALPLVRQSLVSDVSPQVRGAAARAFLFLAQEPGDRALISSLVHDPSVEIQRQVLIGLLERGCWSDLRLAHRALADLSVSTAVDCRLVAAQAIAQARWPGLGRLLRPLLDDPIPAVRRAALHAAGRLGQAELWPRVLRALDEPGSRSTASQALVYGLRQGDPELMQLVENRLAADAQDDASAGQSGRLLAACSRSEVPDLIPYLWRIIDDPLLSRQTLALAGLVAGRVQATEERRINLRKQIEADAGKAAWLIQCTVDFGGQPELETLNNALGQGLRRIMDRILLRLVLFSSDPQVAKRLADAQTALVYASGNARAFAVDLLDASLPRDMKGYLLPLWENLPMDARLARLSGHFPQVHLPLHERLSEVITASQEYMDPHVRAWAIYAASRLSLLECRPAIIEAGLSDFPLLQETAQWALAHLETNSHVPSTQAISHREERSMLTTIERMLILKTASIFAYIPDEVVSEIAGFVEEIDAPVGKTIINKGEIGDCMYIIVSGRVRVHDGERTLNFLGERQEFGEIALLDREPRSASVTPVEDSLLLRLDQEPFYELMEEHSDFSRGVIRSLIDKLRKT